MKSKRSLSLAATVTLSTLLAACSSSGPAPSASKKGKFDPKYGVSASVRVAEKKGEFRKGGGHYKIGKPYKVAGKTYRPKDEPGYNKKGKASWYGDDFHGRLTANGEIFDMNTLTAAHPTLPLPSYARVTNLKNGRSVIVRINDRGPYAHGRVIDLSKRTAEVLAFKNDGITDVRVKYIGKARMDGLDERYLEASYRKSGQRIGNDATAVPKEGQEHRLQAPVMMAKAAPPAQKRNNYILAHVPNRAPAKNPIQLAAFRPAIAPANPTPQALASQPMSGWAHIDLVGDGKVPNSVSNASMRLNYAPKRVEQGYAAINQILESPSQSSAALKTALSSRAQNRQLANSNITLGHFAPAYANRIAIEFAHLAAIDHTSTKDGKITLTMGAYKSGVSERDITALKTSLGLK